MKPGYIALMAIGALGIGVCALAGIDYQLGQEQHAQRTAIFGDIVEGKTIGGTLHSEYGLVCFDAADAFRARADAGFDPRTEAVRDQLIATWRCMPTSPKAAFDMTADGRERFVTPHGTVELWSSDAP